MTPDWDKLDKKIVAMGVGLGGLGFVMMLIFTDYSVFGAILTALIASGLFIVFGQGAIGN